MPDAPSYQSIATFDYTVSRHRDDFGPYTVKGGQPTLTDGIQEALEEAGDEGSVFVRSGTYTLHKGVVQKGKDQLLFCEPGVVLEAAPDYEPGIRSTPPDVSRSVTGMICLGSDGPNDYDGFIFEGNGCKLDGKSIYGPHGGPGGIHITGCDSKPLRFSVRNFRAQNFNDYGLAIGRANQGNTPSGSVVGLVNAENFELLNCGWIRVWAAEHVLIRKGRCGIIPHVVPYPINGWFVTSQHTVGTQEMITRDVVFDDVLGDATGSIGYDCELEVQGQWSGNPSTSDITRDIVFRRCLLRGTGSPCQGVLDMFIDDVMGAPGPAFIESLLFEDCVFDKVVAQERKVDNDSEGYVIFDHCEFLNGSHLPPVPFGSAAHRPVIATRPVTSLSYPDQTFDLTLGINNIYENTHRYVMVAIISGGTETRVLFIPQGYPGVIDTGQAAGAFLLSTGDKLKITYTTPPTTMKGAPLYSKADE